MPELPVLAVRGSPGITMMAGPPKYEMITSFPKVTSRNCKVMTFSSNGQLFAWFDGTKITVITAEDCKILCEIQKPRTSCIAFSPNGTYLTTWEMFTVSPDNPKGSDNFHMWKTCGGSLVKSFVHKKQINWQPQWSKDEKLCARLSDGKVIVYENGNFECEKYKIDNPQVENFSLSPTVSTYHILCYMPGTAAGLSLGKLFKYPRFDACIGNKTFSKANKVDMYWNNKGTKVLLLTSTDVDKTGSSYYGKQALFFLSTKGENAIVVLNKEGPIYDVCWHPGGEEFCVVYGTVPAKAALFDSQCKLVYDFGASPKNAIYFNPHGNLLLLGGFGNISGNVEMWDVASKRKIAKFTASNTTILQWSPDGAHFVTATTAPRLRVDNGFKIWHYSGALMYERPWNKQEELWEVAWRTYPDGTFKKPAVSFKHVEGIQPTEPEACSQPYRPPCARGLPMKKTSLRDEPEETAAESRTVSKNTMKMKKKRETKRLAKLQGNGPSPPIPSPAPSTSRINHRNVPACPSVPVPANEHSVGITKKKGGNEGKTTKRKEKGGGGGGEGGGGDEAAKAGNSVAHSASDGTLLTDKDARIKKIRNNLKGIEKLKQLQSEGKTLDHNQLGKINKEADLLAELEELTV